jgi:hypothetical protein
LTASISASEARLAKTESRRSAPGQHLRFHLAPQTRQRFVKSRQSNGSTGLAASSDFITAIEEQSVIAAIDAADLSPFRFQGWTGKRLTASYRWSYDYAFLPMVCTGA